jgi:hypothetical protein
MEKIFVQIASYRDSELIETVNDCIAKAKYPERLTFGIVNQFSESDAFCFNINKYAEDYRFKILNIDFKESLGACWARSETNKMYKGEEYFLQIDSHTRFIQEWDFKLINSWSFLNDKKAIYTSYPAPYNPGDKNFIDKVYIIHTYAIKNHRTSQRPKSIPENYILSNKPYAARHVAAGFIFASGRAIIDVPYDPNFYFSGEETSMAIRYYTHGYNIYHPSENFLWHYYTRKDCPKHWRDNKAGNFISKSKDRLMALVGLKKDYDLGTFGIGSERTLEDFKKYSGIDFERNILHQDVIDAKECPVSEGVELWSSAKKIVKKTLKWDNLLIDEAEDISFWAFFIKDCNNNTFQRKDILKEKYPDIISKKNNRLELEISYFHPAQEPKSFAIWPFSKSKRWMKKSPIFPIAEEESEKIIGLKSIKQNIERKNKILILGSGKSGLDVKKYENFFDFIIVVNNAWQLTEKWNYWIHPNDYKGFKPDSINQNQVEIKANGYGKSLKKYGGIHECGFSIMLNASYWVLDNLNPKEIYYLGADMNYKPDENGKTHFYGVGFDIKNKGISDPDLMVKLRSKGDSNYLINIYKRFERIANENFCELYNLSKDKESRLPYQKFFS